MSNPTGNRRKGSRIGRVLTIAFILLVLTFSSAILLHRSLLRLYAPVILNALASKLQEDYDLEITWEGYIIEGLNDFSITGITLEDIPSDTVFLTTGSVNVKTSLFALLVRGQDPIGAVTSIELERPVAIIGREEGRWNIENLFKPTEREPFEFPGRLEILIRDGAVEWQGGEVTRKVPVPPSRITGLQGVVRMSPGGGIGLNMEGTLSSFDIEPTPVNILGTYNPDRDLININIEADAIDLELMKEFASQRDISDISGFADTRVSIIIGPEAGEGGFGVLGQATLTEGAITIDTYPIPIQDLGGEFHFTNESVFTSNLTALVDGAVVTIRGRIADFGNNPPSTNLVIESDDFRAGTIRRYIADISGLPRLGLIEGRAEVSISSAGLEAIISASSPSLTFKMFPYSLNEFYAWFSEKKLVIQRAEAGILGGTILADGIVDFSNKDAVYDFHVTAMDLRCEDFIPFIAGTDDPRKIPSGFVSADLEIMGGGETQFTATGIIDTGPLTVPAYPDLAGLQATIPITYSENMIQINGAAISSSGAILLAEGTYNLDGSFDGSVALTVDDRDLIKMISGVPLEGEFAVAGDVAYNTAGLVSFNGETYVTDGRIAALSIPNLSARVSYDSQGIVISDLSGLVGGGEIEADLAISRNNGTSDAGTFAVRGLNIGQLLPSEYSSIISTSLDVSGDVGYDHEAGVLEFDMSIVDEVARVGPNAVSTGDEGISLKVALDLHEGGRMSIDAGGALDSRLAGAPVYYGRVLTPFSFRVVEEVTVLLAGRASEESTGSAPEIPVVTGMFNIQAEINNLPGDITGSLVIDGQDFEIYDIDFSSINLTLGSTDSRVWDVQFLLDAGNLGEFEIDGWLDRTQLLTTNAMELTAEIRNSALDSLLSLIPDFEPERTTGSVSGSGVLTGSITNPIMENFELILEASDESGELEIFGIPIRDGGANFSFDWPILNLTNFEIIGREGFQVLGAGEVDITSPSLNQPYFVLALDGFNLQTITTAGQEQFPLSGTASLTVELSPHVLGPKVHYNVVIEKMEYLYGDGAIPLGRLTFNAETRYGEDRISIDELLLERQNESILITGYIPAKGQDPDANLLDLVIACETGYTIPVPPGTVSPVIAWDGGLGPVDLTVTGSYRQPLINGAISLALLNIQYYESAIIQGVEGTIVAENSVITVSPDSFKIKGGNWGFGLEGMTDLVPLFKGEETSARIALVPESEGLMTFGVEGVEVHLQPGIGENALTLIFQGSGLSDLSATMAGNIDIVGGQVDINNLPEFSNPAPPDQSGRIGFDISLELTAGLRVQSGSKFDVTFEEGSLRLTGPVDRPALSGSIIAPEGWIDIFGNHFVLIEPLEFIFSSVYPPNDPIVSATAQTHLREVRSESNFGEELTITARINDRLRNMEGNIQLTSDPPLGEDQLLAALLYEDFVFRTVGNLLFNDNPMDPGFEDIDLTGTFLPIASSYLTRQIRREAGFIDFEFSFDQYQNLFIYLEKEVLDDVVMYYSQTFGPDAEDDYQWGTRYRWRSRSWVGFEVNNDEEILPQVVYIVPID